MKGFLFVLAVAFAVVTVRAAAMVNSFERSTAWSASHDDAHARG